VLAVWPCVPLSQVLAKEKGGLAEKTGSNLWAINASGQWEDNIRGCPGPLVGAPWAVFMSPGKKRMIMGDEVKVAWHVRVLYCLQAVYSMYRSKDY
jgi:hypothetical protein